MRVADQDFGLFDFLTVLVVAALAMIANTLLAVNPKYHELVVFTAILFGVVLLWLRPLWSRAVFWVCYLVALIVHTAIYRWLVRKYSIDLLNSLRSWEWAILAELVALPLMLWMVTSRFGRWKHRRTASQQAGAAK